MTDTSGYVIEGLIARVKSQVSDLNNRIFTMVPQNSIFPFCFLRYNAIEASTKTNDAFDVTVTLSIYAQHKTSVDAMTQVTKIGRDIHNALNNYKPTITDGTVIFCRRDGVTNCIYEDDGKTAQYLMQFKLLTTT